jgi:hypothetical protein
MQKVSYWNKQMKQKRIEFYFRLIVHGLGGEGYLNFIGNEFGNLSCITNWDFVILYEIAVNKNQEKC